MIEIKRALPNELNIVQDIAQKTWPVTYGGILSDQALQYMLEQFYGLESLNQNLRDGHLFFIAWDSEKPVGFASCVFNVPQKGTTKIPKIYVLPETQGSGIGRKLIDHISAEAQQHGSRQLTLNVNRNNNARYFYEKLGFLVERSEDVDIGNGFVQEDYVMAKPLHDDDVVPGQ
jgi:ribosomal protein S18 acetylase RimI-like enzyme